MKKYMFGLILLVISFFLYGFNLDHVLVPRDEILSGGPPKDGIPAILTPKFVTAENATFLKENDQVIGLKIGDLARAYPIKILNWHEAVNDVVGKKPIVVSF